MTIIQNQNNDRSSSGNRQTMLNSKKTIRVWVFFAVLAIGSYLAFSWMQRVFTP